MPGTGPAPKLQSRTRHKPTRGEWQDAPATGWQHGAVPKPPTGLSREARAAWKDWFASWVASFWRPEDTQALRTTILLYNLMLDRPSSTTATALGQYLDRFGLTPKGLQDRRWHPPKEDETHKPQAAPSTYRDLRVV